MFFCRGARLSAATSFQGFNSIGLVQVQVKANRVGVTWALRNNYTVCWPRVYSGYAQNSPDISHSSATAQEGDSLRVNGGDSRRFISTHLELSHDARITPFALNLSTTTLQTRLRREHSNTVSSRPWVNGDRKIFDKLYELECVLFTSGAKVGVIRSPTTDVQMRTSSTAAKQKREIDAGEEDTTDLKMEQPSTASPGEGPQKPAPEEEKPSKTQQLKKVFKEYGAVGVSFHVCISLTSLGIFYLAVSSGIDMAAVLSKVGFSETLVQSKMAAGTSTFVLAYAVHKLFAPLRISITLVSVPLIVRYLRKTGLFKPPASAP